MPVVYVHEMRLCLRTCVCKCLWRVRRSSSVHAHQYIHNAIGFGASKQVHLRIYDVYVCGVRVGVRPQMHICDTRVTFEFAVMCVVFSGQIQVS